MICGGHKNRGEVDRVDPQILEIIQLFIYTNKVTTLEAIAGDGRIPGFYMGGFF